MKQKLYYEEDNEEKYGEHCPDEIEDVCSTKNKIIVYENIENLLNNTLCCKACKNGRYKEFGNGYCAKHSFSGIAYIDTTIKGQD
jgi:hypothetical protein